MELENKMQTEIDEKKKSNTATKKRWIDYSKKFLEAGTSIKDFNEAIAPEEGDALQTYSYVIYRLDQRIIQGSFSAVKGKGRLGLIAILAGKGILKSIIDGCESCCHFLVYEKDLGGDS